MLTDMTAPREIFPYVDFGHTPEGTGFARHLALQGEVADYRPAVVRIADETADSGPASEPDAAETVSDALPQPEFSSEAAEAVVSEPSPLPERLVTEQAAADAAALAASL